MKSSEMHSTESTEQDREILYALRKRDPNCVDISVGTLEHVIDRLDEADLDERLCAGLDIYYKATARRLIAQPQDAGELKAFVIFFQDDVLLLQPGAQFFNALIGGF